MNVLEAVWGEGGVVGTGSPDCTRDPQQSQERGGGRGKGSTGTRKHTQGAHTGQN